MGKNLVVTTINQDSSLEEKIVSKHGNEVGDEDRQFSKDTYQLYQSWLEKQDYCPLGYSAIDLHY